MGNKLEYKFCKECFCSHPKGFVLCPACPDYKSRHEFMSWTIELIIKSKLEHFIHQANYCIDFKIKYGLNDLDAASLLGYSKSDFNRLCQIGQLSDSMKARIYQNKAEKYVALLCHQYRDNDAFTDQVRTGQITKRVEAHKFLGIY